MDQHTRQPDVSAPAARLLGPVALWGGGGGLLAIAAASGRGLEGSASLGVASVMVAAIAGFGLLVSLRPRAMERWVLPLLLTQMMRTLLAPSLGLAVFLLTDVDAVGFWLSLLATASSILVGETIAISKMYSMAPGSDRRLDGEVAA